MSPPGRIVVIGVGHRDRADDGIGPAVVDALAHRTDAVATLVREGDLAVLPLLWDADDDVVIVDALGRCRLGWRFVELDPDDLTASVGLSTHGLSIVDAIELARRLHSLPTRLRVFGVTGRNFEYGPMSRTLHRRLDSIVDELMVELGIADDVAVADSA